MSGFSPTSSHPSSGSATIQTREQAEGNPITVVDGGAGSLTWDVSDGPNVLLDRSTATDPVVVTAGVYAVAVVVQASGLTAGGSYKATLELDRSGFTAQVKGSCNDPLWLALTLSETWYIPVGGALRVGISSLDGAASRDFTLKFGIVQRLS